MSDSGNQPRASQDERATRTLPTAVLRVDAFRRSGWYLLSPRRSLAGWAGRR
jgi:hypothetical protein